MISDEAREAATAYIVKAAHEGDPNGALLLEAFQAAIDAATEAGWREGYAAGAYRPNWAAPPRVCDITDAWNKRQERKAREAAAIRSAKP